MYLSFGNNAAMRKIDELSYFQFKFHEIFWKTAIHLFITCLSNCQLRYHKTIHKAAISQL